ncbi:hypothetical protein EIP86_001405 [Pleurotus ostreatoroseus]|nr:hypothetical protein EIP86_001405 [Pleurotus ostreatoroseus]
MIGKIIPPMDEPKLPTAYARPRRLSNQCAYVPTIAVKRIPLAIYPDSEEEELPVFRALSCENCCDYQQRRGKEHRETQIAHIEEAPK